MYFKVGGVVHMRKQAAQAVDLPFRSIYNQCHVIQISYPLFQLLGLGVKVMDKATSITRCADIEKCFLNVQSDFEKIGRPILLD